MRILKRAFISIKSRLGKSVLLGLVLLIAMTLVLSSIGIQNGVEQASELAKNEIKANVSIRLDHRKIGQATKGQNDIYELVNDTLLERIKKSEYVKKIKTNLTSYVTTNQKTYEDKKQNSVGQGGIVMDGMEGNGEERKPPTNLLLSADNEEDCTLFEQEKGKLIEGEFPWKSTQTNPIIISKEYATLNTLKIGDTMQTSALGNDIGNTTFTIVGLFEVTAEINQNQQFYLPMNDERNLLITNLNTGREAYCKGFSDCKIVYENIDVELNSGDNIIPFIEYLKQGHENNEKYLAYKSDLEVYEKQTKMIQNVANISSVIVWIVGITTIAIITLLLFISLRDRKYELGVLLSIGETKISLMIQIILEVLLITIFAFAGSFATSSLVANNMSKMLLSNQKSQTDKHQDSNNEIIFIGPGGEEDDKLSNTSTIDTIDVKITEQKTILQSFGLGVIIIIIATIIPISWLIRTNPKKIMLRE